MDSLKQVGNLINCLTKDEDLRQELWVHYLSGNDVDSFVSHLEQIKLEYNQDLELKRHIWTLLNRPLNRHISDIMRHFTELEKSILCLIMLGLSVPNIAQIKGASEVRIRQLIASIRYNECWSTFYGTQEKANGRRKIRID